MDYKMYFVVTSYSALKLVKKTNAKNILISYFYLRKDRRLYDAVLKEREFKILIDSGLYSFWNSQKNKVSDKENKNAYSKANEYESNLADIAHRILRR